MHWLFPGPMVEVGTVCTGLHVKHCSDGLSYLQSSGRKVIVLPKALDIRHGHSDRSWSSDWLLLLLMLACTVRIIGFARILHFAFPVPVPA